MVPCDPDFSGLQWHIHAVVGQRLRIHVLPRLVTPCAALPAARPSPGAHAPETGSGGSVGLVIMAVVTTFATSPLLHLITKGEPGATGEAAPLRV